MAESATAELKALAGDVYEVTAGGVVHRVGALKVRQLGAVIDLAEPVLQLIAGRAEEMERDAAAVLSELVINEPDRAASLLATGTELPREVVDEMTLDELISGFAAFLKGNPLFFSRLLRRLATLLEAEKARAGSTPVRDSSEQGIGTET